MTDYRVRFCNDLGNSTGHMFHTCQAQMTIRSAASEDEAVEAAKREFESEAGIASWQLRASSIECEEIDKTDR